MVQDNFARANTSAPQVMDFGMRLRRPNAQRERVGHIAFEPCVALLA